MQYEDRQGFGSLSYFNELSCAETDGTAKTLATNNLDKLFPIHCSSIILPVDITQSWLLPASNTRYSATFCVTAICGTSKCCITDNFYSQIFMRATSGGAIPGFYIHSVTWLTTYGLQERDTRTEVTHFFTNASSSKYQSHNYSTDMVGGGGGAGLLSQGHQWS